MVSARDVCTHLYRYVCTGGIKHALRMHNALDGAEPSELGEERRHLDGDFSGALAALAARRPGGGLRHEGALRRVERHLGKGSQE